MTQNGKDRAKAKKDGQIEGVTRKVAEVRAAREVRMTMIDGETKKKSSWNSMAKVEEAEVIVRFPFGLLVP